ncbi:hypothetical protein DSAG12_03926 [Promethearchaeum syntrophicum]|uniref:Uncharacterized protein n=1 Tax=Promethearchaeum syntrophicum TaxID=2594042 RepID=A0A5B9DFM7_9ARCH|nr:hypothetical protein [Candidatus Prometheoarchaeum syntrophicum]QEE18088.1 hypothetical protein DSAG12_03926 [Candidatus Prometheoarchaeum syntrophicum]
MVPNDEEEEIEEEEEFVENKFICRDCKKTVEYGEGDDMILLCDDCLELYNQDKIWKDFDKEKIKEEDLKTFELAPYLNPKGKKKKGL